MGFFSFFGENRKKPDVQPTGNPQESLEELKKREANLSEMMAKGGKDFRNPEDPQVLANVRARIGELEATQPTPPTAPETPSAAVPQQIPAAPQKPELPKAA